MIGTLALLAAMTGVVASAAALTSLLVRPQLPVLRRAAGCIAALAFVILLASM